MSKPVHHHIRAYDRALELLVLVGEADAQGRGHTPEARQILACVGKPADRARAKAEKPKASKSDQDWHKARDAADEALSQYVRFHDTKGGETLAERSGCCITCGKMKRGTELQCGHWISRKFFGTRWHEFNVGAQCQFCNSPMGGHGMAAEFEAAIKMIRGNEWPDKLRFKAKVNARKPTVMELQKITEEFRNKLAALKEREAL